MSNSFNLPPILQEFDQFISLCKKLNTDLTKATSRLTELETDLAKEKAERRNLQNTSQRKIQEISAQNESMKADFEKSAKTWRDESIHLRNMLMSAQNEHKNVLKIIQEELERTQTSLKSENQAKSELQNELQKSRSQNDHTLGLHKREQEAVKSLTQQLKLSREELEKLKTFLKEAQQDYARIVENSGKVEEAFQTRETELKKQLQIFTTQAKSEQESRTWLNNMLIKLQKDYEKLYQQFQVEQQKTKGLQDQLAHEKKNQKSLDEARKSAQAIANQLKNDLNSTKTELETLKTANPLELLIKKRECKIQEITQHLSELPNHHPHRKNVSTQLDTQIAQKSYLEQILKEEKGTEIKKEPNTQKEPTMTV